MPCIKASLSVTRDLSISVCIYGEKIDVIKFNWVLGDGGKLDCWSKLSALFSHLQSANSTTADKSVKDKISDAVNVLSVICDSDIDVCVNDDDEENAKFQRNLQFCVQQLRLMLSKQIRYPADLLRWAFQVFSLSPCAYLFMRDSCLILPHPTYLRTLSSCFVVEAGLECNEHIAYLTEKAKLLPEHERNVILMLDEISMSAPRCHTRLVLFKGLKRTLTCHRPQQSKPS